MKDLCMPLSRCKFGTANEQNDKHFVVYYKITRMIPMMIYDDVKNCIKSLVQVFPICLYKAFRCIRVHPLFCCPDYSEFSAHNNHILVILRLLSDNSMRITEKFVELRNIKIMYLLSFFNRGAMIAYDSNFGIHFYNIRSWKRLK